MSNSEYYDHKWNLKYPKSFCKSLVKTPNQFSCYFISVYTLSILHYLEVPEIISFYFNCNEFNKMLFNRNINYIINGMQKMNLPARRLFKAKKFDSFICSRKSNILRRSQVFPCRPHFIIISFMHRKRNFIKSQVIFIPKTFSHCMYRIMPIYYTRKLEQLSNQISYKHSFITWVYFLSMFCSLILFCCIWLLTTRHARKT